MHSTSVPRCQRACTVRIALLAALLSIVGCPWLQAAEPVAGQADASAAPASVGPGEDAAGNLYFEQQVRPLLVEHCQKCHGIKKAESSLRLDSRAALMQGGDNGPAVVVGQAEKSLLIRAVKHEGDFEMPPDEKLGDQQIAALTKWVEIGAPWPAEAASPRGPKGPRAGPITDEERKFWSFQPVHDPAPPNVQNRDWPAGPLDRFILAGLEAKGLTPAKPASKAALLRRASFDLTGLPPTPDELRDFLADSSPSAFAKVLDRLLASPAYGERWARHWLDVVRYADTAGETADIPVREAYLYRNWVIDAFNADKPYDAFIREQVAGDILAKQGPPEEFAARNTGTGFLAISRRFGFDPQNYQHLTIQDTIDTLGQSVLGLSLGCARCHDHKYDPLTAQDYYAMYGIFASTKYAFPGSEESRKPVDFVPLEPADAATTAQAKYDAEIARLDEAVKQTKAQRDGLSRQLAGILDMDGGMEGQKVGAPLSAPWAAVDGARVSTDSQSPFANVYPAGKQGIFFPNDAANNAIIQKLTPTRTPATHNTLFFNIDFRNTHHNAGGDGAYRIYLGHGPGTSAAFEAFVTGEQFLVRNDNNREVIRPVQLGTWYNLQVALDLDAKTFSGLVGVPGDVTKFEGKAFSQSWDGNLDQFFVDAYGGGGVKPAHDIDSVAVSDSAFSPVGETPAQSVDRTQQAAELKGQVAAAEQKIKSLEETKAATVDRGPFPVCYGVTEGTPQNAKIQKRGEPTKLGDEVPRRFLDILGGDPLPPEAGSGRLALAEWLSRPQNPLTARVMANRIWQHHFTSGIVSTESDFGARGRAPTHPELLDWLATRFMAEGWSIKRMHRLILLSQTYQMSTAFDPHAAEVDPADELLWRFPRRRLDAEEFRDSLLALGGNLDPTRGGPHPFPPVASWAYTQHNPFIAVYDNNRRSIYLMTQRLKRHPFLGLWDGPDASASTAKRSSTTVPTQSLYLMNDPFVHQQSDFFAARLLAAAPDATQRTPLAYLMILGRQPLPLEQARAEQFVARYREQLSSSATPVERVEPLAWAALARTLFASNDFMFVD